MEEIVRLLPFGVTDKPTVLGTPFDCGLSSQKRLDCSLEKAKGRLAVLNGVAVAAWGLETSILRLTQDALLVSLHRYGILLLVSSLREKHFPSLESRLTDIASRRIAGAGRSARLLAPHTVAGIFSALNLYICNCAFGIDRAPRAHNSSTRTDLLA